MQSSELSDIVHKFESIKSNFSGVFSLNRIPKRLKIKSFLIANTQDDSKPGQHWFAIIKVSPFNYEYFDSLGVTNEKLQNLNALHIFPLHSSVKFNETAVQSKTSDTCGLFVLYFLIQRMHNFDLSFNELLDEIFDIDCEKNENTVKLFAINHF